MNTQTIELDVDKRGCGNNCIRIAQGESGGTTIKALIYDNGAALALTGYAAYLVVRLPDRIHYYKGTATVNGATVSHVCDESKLASVAGYTDEAYFEFTKDSQTVQTERFALDILRDAREGNTPAQSWDNAVAELIERAEGAVTGGESAVAKANEALTVANAAVTKAGTATADAKTATSKAITAATKAGEAADTANDAATGAKNAASSANAAATNADAATAKAEEAASSATDAASSATTAADKANTAATKAGEAADTANDAATGAKNAASSANAAATAAITAAAEARGAMVPVYDDETGRYTNASIASWLTKQRDGKIYGVSIPKGSATDCSKTGANAGIANPVPGVIGTPAIDPYVGMGCFQFYEVNGGVDEDGMPYVTAWNGDGRFSRSEDTFILAPTLFTLEAESDDSVELSVSDSRNSGMQPQPGACLPDGTLRPFMLYPKYALSVDADGNPRSVSGQPVKRFVSHDTGVTLCKTSTTGYSFKTAADDWYVKAMFLLKYASKNSQSVFAGCTSHNDQVNPTLAESNTTRVVISSTKAANIPVGSSMMLGTHTGTSTDRGAAYNYDVFAAAKVIRKIAVDDSNTALYFDSEAFDVETTYLLSTCPWHTGACDAVEGDGSPTSNTNGREPFTMQGIELALGMYEVLGNVLLNSAGSGFTAYVNPDTRDEAKARLPDTALSAGAFPGSAAAGWNYALYPKTINGLMIQQGSGASTSTGVCDGNYKNEDTATGLREWRSLGDLWRGGSAGLWCVNGDVGTSVAWWGFGSRLSVLGRSRGEAA